MVIWIGGHDYDKGTDGIQELEMYRVKGSKGKYRLLYPMLLGGIGC